MLVTMGRTLTPRHHPDYRYPGLRDDPLAGISDIGALIRDAWVLGVLPEQQDCRGWSLERLRALRREVARAWRPYQSRPARLPAGLRERYLRIHGRHTRAAREQGWRPVMGTG